LLDRGKIEMDVEIDAKTEEAEKVFKNNPHLIKKHYLNPCHHL